MWLYSKIKKYKSYLDLFLIFENHLVYVTEKSQKEFAIIVKLNNDLIIVCFIQIIVIKIYYYYSIQYIVHYHNI